MRFAVVANGLGLQGRFSREIDRLACTGEGRANDRSYNALPPGEVGRVLQPEEPLIDTTIGLYLLGGALVLVGLAGLVLPVLPGIVLVFAGLVVGAWADGFSRVGAWGIAIIGVLAAVAFAVDFLASLLGAKRVGASGLALAGAGLGAFVGLLFGVPGLILGPFIGAVAGELIARRDLVRAGQVGLATWVGMVLGAVTKVILAFMMIATFAAFYLLSGG